MALFTVSYDLRKKSEFDYQKLWDEFGRLDSVKFQESEYFLSSDNTATEVKDHFAGLIHADDLLMVIKFEKRPSFHKALKGTTAWIEAHFP
ncbi:hypothetical protein SAMN05216304_109150 [Bosea sp. OK403]|uniref:hypothetical protein n=1 Tax=Bosea sp. OK403 TaxID=1855286 RepID=UPI0008E26CC2|nr:hypothetical protein [Bosea sp. OK403]SFJ55078.1 hypothetical protein SAMN05216304_109150 [Bosea sp. OK403]